MVDQVVKGRCLSSQAALPPSGLSRQEASQAEPAAANAVWPVFEFRPLESDLLGTVLRYADGAWLPDDGMWDIAFVSYGFGAPLGLYVDLPYQRNIIWSGLTTHWRGSIADHPRGNPWHYMLREGATAWGGGWGRDRHPNTRAGDAAMNKCCSINRCANGTGPEFKTRDRYIERGLVRDRETKVVVEPPKQLTCMYCGDQWHAAVLASQCVQQARALASVDTHPKDGDAVAAPLVSGAVPAEERADAHPGAGQ